MHAFVQAVFARLLYVCCLSQTDNKCLWMQGALKTRRLTPCAPWPLPWLPHLCAYTVSTCLTMRLGRRASALWPGLSISRCDQIVVWGHFLIKEVHCARSYELRWERMASALLPRPTTVDVIRLLSGAILHFIEASIELVRLLFFQD